jgi:hypothetical protein
MDLVQEELQLWRGLIKHEAWTKIEEMLKEQQAGRIQKVMLNPLETQDAALEQEFMKGEYAAFGLILELPYTLVDNLETELRKRKVEADDVEG